MILLDIDNLTDIDNMNVRVVRFINNGLQQSTRECAFLFGVSSFPASIIIEKTINFNELLGMGSYGSVYKITINGQPYAFKISHNEIPEKINAQHHNLKQHLQQNVIDIYCAGILIGFNTNHFQINKNDNSDNDFNSNSSKIVYYSIMEFGGMRLEKYHMLNQYAYLNVLKQIVIMVIIAQQNRILIQDLKMDNLTITNTGVVKLIDIYTYCNTYSPCTACHITRTYSAIEMDTEKKKSSDGSNYISIYENPKYNFTGIYIPFAVLMVNLTCKRDMNYYCKTLMKLYDMELRTKFVVQLLQIACYNYRNDKNTQIKEKYKKMYKFKKETEREYKFIKNEMFFKNFVSLLEVRSEYKNLISNKLLALIMHDLLSMNPDERSFERLEKLCGLKY